MVMEFHNIIVEYRSCVYTYSVHRKPLIASLSAPDQRTSMKLSNRHCYAYYPLPFNHSFYRMYTYVFAMVNLFEKLVHYFVPFSFFTRREISNICRGYEASLYAVSCIIRTSKVSKVAPPSSLYANKTDLVRDYLRSRLRGNDIAREFIEK